MDPEPSATTYSIETSPLLAAGTRRSFDAAEAWLDSASLRSSTDISNAVLAIVVAALLLWVRRTSLGSAVGVVLASGFLATAVLDGTRGFVRHRDAGAWLHALSIAASGAFFACAWIPERRLAALGAWLPAIAVATSAALAVAVVAFADALPPMSGAGALHPGAATLGLGGAALLVAASIRLRKSERPSAVDAPFALYCALAALAGVAFLAASAWGLALGTWPAVRCAITAALLAWMLARLVAAAERRAREETASPESAWRATSADGVADSVGLLVDSRAEARRCAEQEADAAAVSGTHHAAGLVDRVIEATPIGMLLVDDAGRIVFANACGHRMFGYEPNHLVGEHVEALVPQALRKSHVIQRERYQREPHVRAMGMGRSLHGVRRDGSEFRIEIGLSPLVMEDGPRVLACVIDISERVVQTARLERVAMELARSNADLDDFAYVASHDLRAPLRAIANLAQWIAEDARPVLPKASQDHLDTLHGRVRRMERLLEDLLAYSRADKADATPANVDVDRLVADVVGLTGPPAGFEVEVCGRLPSALASRAALEQVFRNLIGNAIKHHDRPAGRVVVSGRDLGDLVEYSVADDGPGIPREFHARAFRMFQTLRPRDEVEGSGMGLALVKKLVARGGGEVRIVSGETRGTCIVFTWRKATEGVSAR